MIEIIDLSIGFGERKLLDHVSTRFIEKTLTALIGRNGTGKSTLMKAICGLNDTYEGKILINGENIKEISRNKLSKELAYVNTHRPKIGNLKCKEMVALGRTPYTGWNGKLSQKDWDKVDFALECVGMTDYSNRYFNSLSDGESQKIMIARAIAQDTRIIILDEPTSYLDLPTRYELVKLLKRLTKENGKTILYSTHELDIALKLSDYIALVADHKLYNMTAAEMKSGPLLSHLLPDI